MNKNFKLRSLTILAIAGVCVIGAMAGCKRKGRLTSNYFNFTITPPAATVVKNTSITLTANAAGSAEITPTWEVTPTTAGSFNPAVGREVVFTPTVLGDAVVLATFDGVQAKCQLAVVTVIPPVADSSTAPTAAVYSIYTDQGIPVGPRLGTDVFTGGGLTLSELSTGYTPEGIKYFHAVGATGAFWGVAYDYHRTGAAVNLVPYTNGNLKFSIRLSRTLGPTEKIAIHIDDGGGAAGSADNITTDFMNELSTDWQEVSIPVSTFSPVQDLSRINVPFAIVWENVPTSLTIDVDAVRWEK